MNVFYPPDELHQRRWCDVLNLRFVAPVAYGPGSPSTYLTVPNRTVKVVSAEFYFHKPITVHLELYLFYCFIHFLLYIGQY